MTLTVGSLFAGIGGIELGLEWTGGFRTVWQVERDPYCQRVLAKHWPDAVRHDDVCTAGAHNLLPVDVICGGFPCQDISNAGKRAGIEGERSGLWREYARIVRELRPRYVLVENVAALLGRGLGVVLEEMAACGYDAEWSVLSAQNLGAPHLRERLFVVAYAQRERLRQQPERVSGSEGPTFAPHDGPVQSLANTDRQREPQPEGRQRKERRRTRDGSSSRVLADPGRTGLQRTMGPRQIESVGDSPRHGERTSYGWATEPDVGRVAHGVPARVDRLRALGNAVVPQCAEFVGRLILDMEAERQEAA
jgi:DNA (cytosine-5)-methyltransferase 1